MKKHTSPIDHNLPPVKLYIDDLNTIVATLKEIGPDAIIVLIADGNEFADVAEMATEGRAQLSELSMQAKSGVWSQVIVNIFPTNVFMRAMEDTATNVGVLAKLEKTLRANRTPIASSLFYLYTATALTIFNSASIVLSWFLHVQLPLPLEIAVDAFWLGMGGYSIHLRRHSSSTITLKYRAEELSFWAKNRDAIIVNLFVAIIAVVATLAGEWLLQALAKK